MDQNAELIPEHERDALAVARSVVPQDEVPYAWIADVAKSKYDAFMKAFDDLDAKAGAIIGYMGGGTGLATLGTLFTVLNSSVSSLVVIFTFPAIACSGAALCLAARARCTKKVFPPPTAGSLIEVANQFHGDKHAAEKLKAIMATQWELCSARMRTVVTEKAHDVDTATKGFVIAVFLLVLPLLGALFYPKDDAIKTQDSNIYIKEMPASKAP
ncbi:hypothetical protein GobsT_71090 [Gemmata obscuriglobus]|uniref:Uncharacterized protein n=1 Tax=Gemmata obscuriglobus TaxID=114 RepID=A0A2Z3HIX9_9BACT|nr:hypothetical protein C1280_35505 [Gemmata obscuriglobus]QEG32256.1 hypothetical protein GobsT_71090 [Gemmata obscuriglobus]VTS11612.1 unnamed protein product [Gemmata obscuriglobus UQM 2246]